MRTRSTAVTTNANVGGPAGPPSCVTYPRYKSRARRRFAVRPDQRELGSFVMAERSVSDRRAMGLRSGGDVAATTGRSAVIRASFFLVLISMVPQGRLR